MPTVSVKWQKQVFPAVEIDTAQPPFVFKCQLYELSGVPPERQKIMVKGGLLKDDADWSTLAIKEGQKLMMMGTADEIVKAPEKGPVFMEDLPEEEQVVNLGNVFKSRKQVLCQEKVRERLRANVPFQPSQGGNLVLRGCLVQQCSRYIQNTISNLFWGKGYTPGLYNLGNTCYMNSTLQCLHSVPELKSALSSYSIKSNDVDPSSHDLTVATRKLFTDLDQSVIPIYPSQFWALLRKKYPQFGQQQNGIYMQQDAEECWTQLLYTLSQSLKPLESREASATVKELFGIELVSRVNCVESGEESMETESVLSLKCHISKDVNHLHEGLKNGLKSELEKVSPSLGRSAIYTKHSHISSLPRYMSVQFVRFYWKRESNQKAKILRKVDYPLELDVYDLCSDDLRQKLQGPRQSLRDEENSKFGLKSSNKDANAKEGGDNVMKSEGAYGSTGESSSVSPLDEKKAHLTGVYDLVAVVTHKGRSTDSGHYVAWVKQESGKWVEYDDQNANLKKEEDITRLSGGGDWHMAYILLYKARVVSL